MEVHLVILTWWSLRTLPLYYPLSRSRNLHLFHIRQIQAYFLSCKRKFIPLNCVSNQTNTQHVFTTFKKMIKREKLPTKLPPNQNTYATHFGVPTPQLRNTALDRLMDIKLTDDWMVFQCSTVPPLHNKMQIRQHPLCLDFPRCAFQIDFFFNPSSHTDSKHSLQMCAHGSVLHVLLCWDCGWDRAVDEIMAPTARWAKWP